MTAGRLRKLRKQPMIKVTNLNRIFSPTNERIVDHDERLSFIDSNNERQPMSLSSLSSTTTTSSSSSLASLTSPSHLTPSHIKIKPTLIPTQYRVYIPQKKCEMNQAYTDYVYSTNETTTKFNHNQSSSPSNECHKNSKEFVDTNAT